MKMEKQFIYFLRKKKSKMKRKTKTHKKRAKNLSETLWETWKHEFSKFNDLREELIVNVICNYLNTKHLIMEEGDQ